MTNIWALLEIDNASLDNDGPGLGLFKTRKAAIASLRLDLCEAYMDDDDEDSLDYIQSCSDDDVLREYREYYADITVTIEKYDVR